MKFSSAILALTSAVVTADKTSLHYGRPGVISGPSLWVFGGTGMNLYSPDGATNLVSTPKEEICHNVTGYRGEGFELSCNWNDVVSDGKKYVWAAVSRGVSKIDVFDINTGAVVGSFETCMSPRDLEYHPLRDEIWVRCQSVDPGNEFGGYMEVFAASAPSADTVSTVDLTGNSTLSAYGYSVIDNSLGDVGYATVWNQPTLYKIDLSERKVLQTFEIPLAYGGYEVAYSSVNRHIFVRASVCCTCGFEGSDLGEDCGRYGSDNVTITTGPFAGGVAQGQCGRCDGIVGVDTLGVLEFDTSTDTFVGQHVMPDGAGGDPFGSPDGRHIVLVGRNGGEVVRILSAGKPGEESTVAFDLALGFSTLDEETSAVYSDFAFIQTSASDGMGDGIDRDMIIIASGTENKVAIVDVSTGSPQITIVTMRDDTELTARRNRRQVEWVVGTQYVWIDGTNQEEIYVLDIDSKQVVRTVKGVPTTKMLSVENFAAKRTNDLIAQRISAAISDFVPDMMGSDQDKDKDEDKSKDGDTTYNVRSEMKAASESTVDDNDIDPVGIAALVVGLCALIVGVANMIYMSRSTTSDSGGNNDGGDSVDQKTLGSKNMA